jgi:hypothetical protein
MVRNSSIALNTGSIEINIGCSIQEKNWWER